MEKFRQFITKPWIYILVLVIGISFKFYHIDYRYFWLDQISKIEQTSGANREGISEYMSENKLITIRNNKKLIKTKVF